MDDSIPKISAEQLLASHLAHGESLSLQEAMVTASSSGVIVTNTASTDNQGQPFIIVDWHPHVYYSSLTRVDQTDPKTYPPEMVLEAYDSTFPPYEDRNVIRGQSYKYVLGVPSTTPGHVTVITSNNVVVPKPPHQRPTDSNIIDRVFLPEQVAETNLTEAEQLARVEALNKLAATEVNNVSKENLQG